MTNFRELHKKGSPLILPNAWDRGSALVMQSLGAKALATSSAAHAFTLGRPDMGNVTRDESLSHAQELLSVINIPLTCDLENGFGDSPDDVAQTIRLAGEIGVSGCSIEDTKLPSSEAYDFDLAVERVRAGVAAARSLKGDFMFCARADGVMNNVYDCDEAIRRLRAFEAAGADLLFVPVPDSFDDLERICKSVDTPVNAILAGKFREYRYEDFAKIGVARLSLGSTLARAAQLTLINTTKAALSHEFNGLLQTANSEDVDALLLGG